MHRRFYYFPRAHRDAHGAGRGGAGRQLSSSALAPLQDERLRPPLHPKAVVDYANTRGADKGMYAGYFPMGLSLERIFSELPNVPFRDHVWPKFLRENAVRVFNL